MDQQNRNLILAIVLSALVLITWQILFPPPEVADPDAVTEVAATDPSGDPSGDPAAGTDATAASPPAEGIATPDPAATAETAAPRVAIDTPSLAGSLSLRGGRLDDLSLKGYRVTLDAPELVHLLSPAGSAYPYSIVQGWSGLDGVPADQTPGPDTVWTLVSGGPAPAALPDPASAPPVDASAPGATLASPDAAAAEAAMEAGPDIAPPSGEVVSSLTPDTPVVLEWDNGAGLVFTRTIRVDDKFLFTVEESVANAGATPVRLAPWALIAREGRPDLPSQFILHEGVVRRSDGELQEIRFKDMADLAPAEDGSRSESVDVATEGWVGITDEKYWMTTIIPEPGQPFRSTARYLEDRNIFQTYARQAPREIAPGATATATTFLFAGAKEWETIRAYQAGRGDAPAIAGFLDSIDWGWFFFLTKPMFWLLHHLHLLIGNMGWAIVALTVVIKALVLPLAWKSYASMARMKEIQPQLEALKERTGDDRQAFQQGMMALYKENKVNPAAGCLPILLQIPIFFSLYKVIFVTLELRHAPWIGWIRDLSAPDPSSLYNLFGLLPWDAPAPGTFLHLIFLGALPIVLGISMWLQQKLNPAPTDPTQQAVFAWMPVIFMFMLGGFASGLVLYWIANNTITFAQQYVIMRSHGVKPDILGNIRSRPARKA